MTIAATTTYEGVVILGVVGIIALVAIVAIFLSAWIRVKLGLRGGHAEVGPTEHNGVSQKSRGVRTRRVRKRTECQTGPDMVEPRQ
jgi:hypothetical protein